MMSNSDARKRAAEKAAEDERAGDMEALADVLERVLTEEYGDEGWRELGSLKRIAAVLAARDARLIAEAERRGAERALRDAADRMPAFHDRDVPEWAITSACRWLRDRAAQIGEVRP